MEIGSVTKSSTPHGVSAQPRADPVAGSVKTDLRPDAAVQPVESVRFAPDKGVEKRAALEEVVRRAMERHITIDPKTRAVVVESIDPDTGKVVRQIPDETLLKLRVYARELREAGGAEADEPGRRAGRIA